MSEYSMPAGMIQVKVREDFPLGTEVFVDSFSVDVESNRPRDLVIEFYTHGDVENRSVAVIIPSLYRERFLGYLMGAAQTLHISEVHDEIDTESEGGGEE